MLHVTSTSRQASWLTVQALEQLWFSHPRLWVEDRASASSVRGLGFRVSGLGDLIAREDRRSRGFLAEVNARGLYQRLKP